MSMLQWDGNIEGATADLSTYCLCFWQTYFVLCVLNIIFYIYKFSRHFEHSPVILAALLLSVTCYRIYKCYIYIYSGMEILLNVYPENFLLLAGLGNLARAVGKGKGQCTVYYLAYFNYYTYIIIKLFRSSLT